MAYIPPDAEWYIAEIVIAITVGDTRRPVVHVNSLLVRADSPNEAYEKALELGREHRQRYRNQAGQWVTTRFLGLRDLLVIHDKLEHGAEISYFERRPRSLQDARSIVAPKRKLGVFAPISPPRSPDYMSGEIRTELEARLGRPISGTKEQVRRKKGRNSKS